MLPLELRDHKNIWHPFTQHGNTDPCIAIKRGQGSYLYDYNNNKYLDLISSWWVNLHGHGNNVIAAAIYKQALKLEHVIFAGFTHAPAVELCDLIINKLSNNLTKGFYSDNGSTSVEIALKIIYQYWLNLKMPKRKFFLTLAGGYHGDTLGAMSVGITSGFHANFKPLCFEVLTIPFPDTFTEDQTVKCKEEAALNKAKEYLFQYKNEIAAIILEPLIQGASGMRLCSHNFLEKLINLVKDEGILVILDEVMTGFGRTGTCFALEQLNVTIDVLCLSKGITGGFLPLGLTVVTENIYQAFLGESYEKALLHGHSYTANPLACAAGIASFKLLQAIKTQVKIKKINQVHKRGIEVLQANCKAVIKPRIIGTIAAFEVNTNNDNFNSLFKKYCLNQGLLLRPLGNNIYFIPPYIISCKALANSYNQIVNIINQLA